VLAGGDAELHLTPNRICLLMAHQWK